MKKFTCFFMIVLILALPVSVQAQESDKVELQQPPIAQSQNQCTDDDNSTEIQPLTTCTGNGGVSRINAMGGGGVTWSVDPRFSTVYNFSGSITFVDPYTGVVVDSESISCLGAFGGSCGGEVGMSGGTYGKVYSAFLTGTAIDLTGLMYVISNGACQTSFMYGGLS